MAFVRLEGLEPPTGCLEGSCSIRLSYRRPVCNCARPRSRVGNSAHGRAGGDGGAAGSLSSCPVTRYVGRPRAAGWPVAAGIVAGAAADALLGDPRRGHPVALFGRAALAAHDRVYADSRLRGAGYTAGCVLAAAGPAAVAQRLTRGRPWLRLAATAAAAWTVSGARSLTTQAERISAAVDSGDLAGARAILPSLCGRDPAELDENELARAAVESVAENTGDAIVGPLVWGVLAGLPGLVGYRAVNTLDAMVGYRSPRYARFGWASARLDDVANWAPARLTGILAAACSPVTGGRPGPPGGAVRGGGGGRSGPAPPPGGGGAGPAPGAEIGRAQAMQAAAAGVEPDVRMNPVLLKPGSDRRSQVVVLGSPVGEVDAVEYRQHAERLLHVATDSLAQLRREYDVVICEGAGSPAEINLRATDIANMGLARAAGLPAIVVGDIDRGGGVAAPHGTVGLLEPGDQALVAGFVINRFRRARQRLEPGLRMLSELTGRSSFGIIPWTDRLWLDTEDSLALDASRAVSAGPPLGNDVLRVSVVRLPRISNFTDVDPLAA